VDKTGSGVAATLFFPSTITALIGLIAPTFGYKIHLSHFSHTLHRQGQGGICRGGGRRHVLVTEFRGMALNCLFYANVLPPLHLDPPPHRLYIYIHHPAHRALNIRISEIDIKRQILQNVNETYAYRSELALRFRVQQ